MLRFPSPSIVISMLSLLVALGSAGYSATGGAFILGTSNSANIQTGLVTPYAGAALRIVNTSAAAGASGIKVVTDSKQAPFVINSSTKVANLNADRLDGIDSAGFLGIQADVHGAVSFGGIAASTCAVFNVSVFGAQVGNAVLLSFEGTTELPTGVMLLAEKVTSSGIVRMKLCNPTNSVGTAASNVGVRVITLR